MFRLSMVLAGLMLVSASAFANDTGLPGITVSDIKVSSVKGFGSDAVKTPVRPDAKVVAEFTGASAAKLGCVLI